MFLWVLYTFSPFNSRECPPHPNSVGPVFLGFSQTPHLPRNLPKSTVESFNFFRRRLSVHNGDPAKGPIIDLWSWSLVDLPSDEVLKIGMEHGPFEVSGRVPVEYRRLRSWGPTSSRPVRKKLRWRSGGGIVNTDCKCLGRTQDPS